MALIEVDSCNRRPATTAAAGYRINTKKETKKHPRRRQWMNVPSVDHTKKSTGRSYVFASHLAGPYYAGVGKQVCFYIVVYIYMYMYEFKR